MPLPATEAGQVAERILAAAGRGESIAPISASQPRFGLQEAYAVLSEVNRRRMARGERPVGWKIGFTNRTIWDEYDVHAPIWGPMFDTTAVEAPAEGEVACPLGTLVEPRIEPEIALRLARTPGPDMDETALIGCVDAVAHGFEIVQSVFPGWRFAASDTVAAFALHGCYRHRPFVPVAPGERALWQERLATFSITLFKDGVEIDRGVADNVLGGGPLTALAHLVRGLVDYPAGHTLGPGDIVTTGTVTRAFPVAKGERWSTRIDGLPLGGMSMRLT
ncbi:MAG: hydratase [Porphyrobacter sp.]|nr:hydratase [Porphyrobacter sp.]